MTPHLFAILAGSWLGPTLTVAPLDPRAVRIHTIDADAIEGRLVSFSLRDGAVVQTGAERRTIPSDALVRMSLGSPVTNADAGGTSSDRPADEITLTLAWGDELRGRIAEATKDAVVLETTGLGRVTVALDDLSWLSTAHASRAAHRSSGEWFRRQGSPNEDAALLTNGDVVRGFIAKMDADGVTFDAAGGAASAPYRLVVALHIAHPEPKKLVAPHAVVQVRDTGRLTATDVNLADDTAELHLRSGGVVRCAAERLARIDVAAGRWTWLSELRPVSAEQVPMLALGWDHHVDENVRGGPIVVAGQSFERGLGVHARSVLIFELDGAYREFVTSFGLDDDSGPYADVNVSILVDGRPRFDKTHVRRGILHGPIRLDVSRAGRIALIVDFGDNGDLQDRFDWVEPALIR